MDLRRYYYQFSGPGIAAVPVRRHTRKCTASLITASYKTKSAYSPFRKVKMVWAAAQNRVLS